MKKIFVALSSVLLLTGFWGGFKNDRGERFDFEIDVRKVKEPSPTVLISHGSSCVLQQYYDWAAQINSWGYNSIIIDHCTVRGVRPYTGGFPPKNLQPEDKAKDYVAIAEWVKLQKWHVGKIAVIGFSRGGAGVTNLINSDYHKFHKTISEEQLKLINVAVAFYPACSPFPPPPNPSIPTLIHHGRSDTLSKPRICGYGRLKNPNYRIVLYEGAHHTFDDPGPDVLGTNISGEQYIARRYSKEADNSSREITKQFLEEFLKF
jgi:dienelactone hydrolase